jgi:hypothetical protein
VRLPIIELINRKEEIEPPARTFLLAMVMRQVYFINIENLTKTEYFISLLAVKATRAGDNTKIRMCLLV